jgi:hypothetical protein
MNNIKFLEGLMIFFGFDADRQRRVYPSAPKKQGPLRPCWASFLGGKERGSNTVGKCMERNSVNYSCINARA